MWDARGVIGHALALERKELATWLRLLEALFAPGWAHRDGSVTPAGLLGARTGRAASTDRLALLLLVLEATETGRVRLCGGTVDKQRGRAAVTLARLLGCAAAAAGGERVLERLEDGGLVERPRRETGSGLRHRGRLVVPAVVAAHRRDTVSAVPERRAVSPSAGFSDPDGTARPGETPDPGENPQVKAVPEAAGPGVEDPDATAALHTDHPCVVTEVADGAGDFGFFGEAGRGSCRQPERAGACEDRVAGGEGTPRLTVVDSEGGPLRGEQPESPATHDQDHDDRGQERDQEQQPDAAVRLPAQVGAGHSGQRQGRVPRRPGDLQVVLAAVAGLWARLEHGGARHVVIEAARAQLAAVAGLAGPAVAEAVLADRLTRRLREQGGPAAVSDPVGWLVGKGLPRRAVCSDVRCDDGLRLDTGGSCETCDFRLADRRAVRGREG
ncbi:hypothetical protein [Actinacidiphila oryziradicis]|uniref:Uncharacterized protein n=1 Tax=Actinacidiphila oryziradicis TaxID=2571141 RepID=A0A4U0S852_9ACTN|nr:hypothetical protein [Actinacidiphila oryziradicis]TKA04723.1 hypothetical protein FCI23_34725 [Actinacidiphila oryziradicis]